MVNQKQETIGINLNVILTPLAILLAGLVIAAGLFFGLKNLGSSEKEIVSNVSNEDVVEEEKVLPDQKGAPPGPPANQNAKTSIDDDAIMGNKKTAKIAIVEFSDFECPFCARFREETLGEIKKNYVDTGKAIFVYRDLPLPFHDPAATKESNAAECARKQGGDEIYYQFHDEIYKQTPGNGTGLSEDDLAAIGVDLGLDKDKLINCIENEEFAEEIKKDAADAGQAGISGTPGFVIGKLSQDGTVDGVRVTGAQPYSNFETTIDEQLEG